MLWLILKGKAVLYFERSIEMNNTIQRSIELTQQILEDAKVSGKKVSCSVSGGQIQIY